MKLLIAATLLLCSSLSFAYIQSDSPAFGKSSPSLISDQGSDSLKCRKCR